MGWLKKHLNPNPIKQVKNTISDTKKSIQTPMAMLSGKPKAAAGSTTTGTAPATANTAGMTAAQIAAQKKKTTGLTLGNGTISGITTGQGNAPAPRKYNAPVAAVPKVRATAARTTLSNMGNPSQLRMK